jgi:hypothetical protein
MSDVIDAIRAARIRDEMTGRTFTEYALRYTSPYGSHITEYGEDLNAATQDARQRPGKGHTIELLQRTVQTSPWMPQHDVRADDA